MLSACVFEKRFQKASGQHLLMVLESLCHFDTHFAAFLTLGEPWEGPWHHPGTPLDPDLKKVPKTQQKDIFFRPHFGDLFSSDFLYFPLQF